MEITESSRNEVLWPIIEQYLSPEIRAKLAQDIPLTRTEHDAFLRAEKAFRVVSNALARFPQNGTLSTNETVKQLLEEQEYRLKRHITRRTDVPGKLLDYFAENVEISDVIDNKDPTREVLVEGIKLQMREIACTLIDDYNAVPARAADAVFDYFAGKKDAYDKRLSFRTTVYTHYEISRGCKPEKKPNPLKDLLKLKKIIPGLL